MLTNVRIIGKLVETNVEEFRWKNDLDIEIIFFIFFKFLLIWKLITRKRKIFSWSSKKAEDLSIMPWKLKSYFFTGLMRNVHDKHLWHWHWWQAQMSQAHVPVWFTKSPRTSREIDPPPRRRTHPPQTNLAPINRHHYSSLFQVSISFYSIFVFLFSLSLFSCLWSNQTYISRNEIQNFFPKLKTWFKSER